MHPPASTACPVRIFIAVVNGMSLLPIVRVIILPLWLSEVGVTLPAGPLELSIALAFAALFLLGIFLGAINRRFWLWSGPWTLLTVGIAAGLVLLTLVKVEYLYSGTIVFSVNAAYSSGVAVEQP